MSRPPRHGRPGEAGSRPVLPGPPAGPGGLAAAAAAARGHARRPAPPAEHGSAPRSAGRKARPPQRQRQSSTPQTGQLSKQCRTVSPGSSFCRFGRVALLNLERRAPAASTRRPPPHRSEPDSSGSAVYPVICLATANMPGESSVSQPRVTSRFNFDRSPSTFAASAGSPSSTASCPARSGRPASTSTSSTSR